MSAPHSIRKSDLWDPSYNIAPTQQVTMVKVDGDGLVLDDAR